MPWRRAGLEVLLLLGLWAGLVVFGRSAMFADPGTFWHTVLGQHMLRTGEVPRTETFSFTEAGKPFVDTSWLAECAMAGLYRLGGWDALLLATTALLAIVFGGLAIGLVRAGLHPLAALALLALALGAASQQFHVRPLVLTMALLALTFRWLLEVEEGRRPLWHLAGLTPITALWASLHGGVLGGLGTLLICAAGWAALRVFWHRGPCRGPGDLSLLAAVAAAALAAVLLNPYGVDLPRTWWVNQRLPLGEVLQEHAPLDPTTPYGLVIVLLGAVYGVCLAGAWPRFRAAWLVPVAWYVLGCLAVRHAALFAVTALVALTDIVPQMRWANWLESHEWLDRARAARPNARRSSGAALLVVAILVGLLIVPVARGWARIDPQRWPVELLGRLKAIGSEGTAVPVFNDLRLGGYLIFFTPGLRVFIDDRAEIYGDLLLDYDRARQAEPAAIEAWRRRWGFRHALVEAGSALDLYLASAEGWRPLGRSPCAALYERTEVVGRPARFSSAKLFDNTRF